MRDRLTRSWALLVAVTLVSALIAGAGGAARSGSTALIALAVLAIAFAKAGLVMFEFMELRSAPRALQILACAWLAGALSVLLAIRYGVMI